MTLTWDGKLHVMAIQSLLAGYMCNLTSPIFVVITVISYELTAAYITDEWIGVSIVVTTMGAYIGHYLRFTSEAKAKKRRVLLNSVYGATNHKVWGTIATAFTAIVGLLIYVLSRTVSGHITADNRIFIGIAESVLISTIGTIAITAICTSCGMWLETSIGHHSDFQPISLFGLVGCWVSSAVSFIFLLAFGTIDISIRSDTGRVCIASLEIAAIAMSFFVATKITEAVMYSKIIVPMHAF